MPNIRYYPQEAYPSQQNNLQVPNQNTTTPQFDLSNLSELLSDKNLLSKLNINSSPQVSMLMGLLNQNNKKKSEQKKLEPTDYIKVNDYHAQKFD